MNITLSLDERLARADRRPFATQQALDLGELGRRRLVEWKTHERRQERLDLLQIGPPARRVQRSETPLRHRDRRSGELAQAKLANLAPSAGARPFKR